MNFILQSETDILITKQLKNLENKYRESGDVDVIKYDMQQISLSEILEEANTYPMWSDYKFIICNNANFLNSKGIKNTEFENDYDTLIDYLENKNSFSSLVFISAEKLDKRKSIVKKLEKLCKVFILDSFSSEKIEEVVFKQLKNQEKEISPSNAKYLCKRLNYDLSLVVNELDKLALVSSSEISKDIIDSLVARTIEDNIFELTSAVVDGDVSKSYSIYNDLIMQKEEPIAMIAMIANQFRLILQVKGYANQGLSKNEVAKQLGVHPYRVELAMKKSYLLEEDILYTYMDKLCEMDYSIKTGKLDKFRAMELFLLTL